jgi:hypothetical protein
MRNEQTDMLNNSATIIELTDEELENMHGTGRHHGDCYHRCDYNDGCGRRFGEMASFDFQETIYIQESVHYSYRNW